MSQSIQVNTGSEGTYVVSYNCLDECGNNSNPVDKERKLYIKGDGDNFVFPNSIVTAHGGIAVFPIYVSVRQNTSYNDRSVFGHRIVLYDGLFNIHAQQEGPNNSGANNINVDRITDNSNLINTSQVGEQTVTYTAYITLPNGYQQIVTGTRTVQVIRIGIIEPPIRRPPVEALFNPPEFNYLEFGTNPEISGDQNFNPAPPGGDGGGGGNLSNETCAMFSISANLYEYSRKIIVRKENNLYTILDEPNSVNLSNLYQELTKGDSNSDINVINNNYHELNPYVNNVDNFTTGPLTANELSYSGNWDIILIVPTNANTVIEYGFLYDISNNKWKIKNYIINTSYVESVSSYEISGSSLEVAELTINYVSLCLEDPTITILGNNPFTHEVKTTYSDQGATAVDDLGNTLTVNVTNNVNKNIIGTYSVIYSTTDTYGNTSTATRTVNVNDTTNPVINLLGDNPMTVEALSLFSDPGATATDNYDNNLNITTSGTVNTGVVGSYTITYSTSDSSGNSASNTRTVKVENNTKPTLIIKGNNPFLLDVHTNFVDPGATATDVFGNSVNVSSTNNINKNVLGNYSVTYSATDNDGNTQTASRTVKVVDRINPSITILGDNPMEVSLNGTYNEPGAIGSDNYTSPINVSISGSVNTSTVGTYTITYSASDSSGNSHSESRTVNVVNNTPPTITIIGSNPLTHQAKTTFTDPGATAVDVYGLSLQVSSVSNVNENLIGNYIITYTATDIDGNRASAVRNVYVRDTIAPVITLNGNSTITLELNQNYVELGATATDNYDASVSVSFSGTVDSTTPGTYIITYSATDSSNNTSTKTRNVIIENNEPPIITVIGADPIVLGINATFTDPGATAVDAVGNSINVNSTDNVNTSQYGTYSVNYTATDIWGNSANARRNVLISDFTAPTVTLIGDSVLYIPLGSTYTDPGATALDPADGNITGNIVISSNVNTGVIGTYIVTYVVSDSEGRTGSEQRTVYVVEPPDDGGSGVAILEGGVPLSTANFPSNGCVNITLSLPNLAGYTGSNPIIQRAIIVRNMQTGGTPLYLYDNGTRPEYKYPNSPLNLSGSVFEIEKSNQDYPQSIINSSGDLLEPSLFIGNSDYWTDIVPVVNESYFGGNWEILAINGHWNDGGSVVVTALRYDISNNRWQSKSWIKNTGDTRYQISNWNTNTYSGPGPHTITGITVTWNMECIIQQCANVSYSASSNSGFDRQIFTKYENSVIMPFDEVNSSPGLTGDFEIMCAEYTMGANVSIKDNNGKILSTTATNTTFNTGPVTTSGISLNGNWELIVSDYSGTATGNIQHALFFSGFYNKWYRRSYIFNNGVVSNTTNGEVSGNVITVSNITFTHNGFNDTVITKPIALGTTHIIDWAYASASNATGIGTIILDTSYPVTWSLSNQNNAGVLSYSNSGNLVITYRKNLVVGGGTSGIGGFVDYPFTFTATASILNNSFDYTINVTHRYYNPSTGGGGGGIDPPPPGDDDDITKDIRDINDPFGLGGL